MLKYWIWLAERKHISLIKKWELIAHFGNPKAAFLSGAYEYAKAGIERQAELDSLYDKDTGEAEKIMCRCDEKGIRILTPDDPNYPSRLRFIPDAPMTLYCLGKLPAIDVMASVAVVGTRKASAYGMTQARRFGYQLSKAGVIVVSGMAQGCDGQALYGALSGGTPVISVLGCGVDVVYPRNNRALYEEIRRYGCFISEYPPGTPPMSEHFPVRNRIISGLSLGVLVVEAPAKSGALITARRALDHGRDVFTIPGTLGDSNLSGNFALLKDGAILVENGVDILREYLSQYPMLVPNVQSPPEPEPFAVQIPEQKPTSDKKSVDSPKKEVYIDIEKAIKKCNADEALILRALADGPISVDDAIEKTKLSASRMAICTTSLQIKKYIRRLPGPILVLATEP